MSPRLPLAPLWALVATAVLFLGAVPPPPTDDAVERVEAGLRAGDPEAVLVDAGSRIEVTLFGQGGMYRRAQATHVLRDFFRRYPPSRVVFGEQATSDDGQTAVWRYWSEDGGAPLTVSVLLRETDPEASELVWVRIDRRSTVRAGL
ncbi:MAG: DUF4783 domain-containing protein [Bacteroidota bacterium]